MVNIAHFSELCTAVERAAGPGEGLPGS